MFRVYIEGKSPEELIKNTKAWLSIITGGVAHIEKVTAIEQSFDDGNGTQFHTEEPFDMSGSNAVPVNSDSLAPAYDSRGCPWDERVHSSTKAVTKDGHWRARRGVDQNALARIEAELMSNQTYKPSTYPAPPAPVQLPPLQVEAPATAPLTIAPTIPFNPPPVAVAPPVQISEPIAIPQTPQKPAHTIESFRATFIPTMAALVANKEIDQAYVDQLKAFFQVKEIWDVAKDDVKSQQLFDALVQGGKITKVG